MTGRTWETADAYLSGPVRAQAGRRPRPPPRSTRPLRAQRRGAGAGAAAGPEALATSPRGSARRGCHRRDRGVRRTRCWAIDARSITRVGSPAGRSTSTPSPAWPPPRRLGHRRAPCRPTVEGRAQRSHRRRSRTVESRTGSSAGCSTPRRPKPPRRSWRRSRRRSRPGCGRTWNAPTGWRASTTTASTTSCRGISTAAI